MDRLCLGTAPLSGIPRLYGYDVDHERALRTVQAWIDGPMRFLDLANGYGDGRGELIVGEAIHRGGAIPEGLVLATKVDPAPGSRVLDARRVNESVEESLTRLGLDRVDILHLHDPELFLDVKTTLSSVVPALHRLVDQGVAEHVGIACGPLETLSQYVESGCFDVALTHNRFSLMDSSAWPFLHKAAALGVPVLNAAPFGGGLLAREPTSHRDVGDASLTYAYAPLSADQRERLKSLRRILADYDVPMAAVALQWSTRSPLVTSTVVGISSPDRVSDLLGLMDVAVPDEVWERLTRLHGLEPV